MRIAVLKKDYDQWGGGAERYAVNACSRLARRGHAVTVFAESFHADPVANLHHRPVPRVLRDGFSRTTAFHHRVQKTLNPKDYDLTLALSRTWPCDIFRVAESIERCWVGRRYPWWQWLNPRHIGIGLLDRQMYHSDHVRAVVCNAELTCRQILAEYRFPPERVRVIRNGVDRSRFSPAADPAGRAATRAALGLRPETFALMFAAANFRSKGLEYAIRGVAALPTELRGRSVLLVLGGYDPAWFRDLAGSLGVGDRIRFEGKRETMPDYYRAADLFFYPTIYEPCANVCLEALNCGLPVLTTALNGAAELVVHGENGYVVADCHRQDEMVALIANFAVLPPERRQAMGEAAVRAGGVCDWERHADALEALCAQIVAEKRPRNGGNGP
jgi:UDP-glucose:(heptosyl)LPS alpha-1,3-glucosyltransferase